MLFINKRIAFLLLYQILFACLAYPKIHPRVSYHFEHRSLSSALQCLIGEYGVSLLYVHNQIDSVMVSSSCSDCSQEEAIRVLLSGTALSFKKVNDQYVVFNPETDDLIPASETALDLNASLEGFIVDSVTNEPLPYAVVLIDGQRKGTVTNEKGYFKIDRLSVDKHSLKILYIGYEPDVLIADLRNGGLKARRIKLNPQSIELDAVIVKRKQSRKVITVQEPSIITFNALGLTTTPTMDQGDIVQNMRLVSGVNIIPDDPMGINLQGGASDQTLILYDQIPLYHTQHLMGFNGLLNADCIDHLTLYTGGYPAKFGDRLSGVLDVVGRSGKNEGLHAGASLNFFTARTYLDLPISKRLSLFTTFNTSAGWFGLSNELLNRHDYTFFNYTDQLDYTGPYGTGFFTSESLVSDFQIDNQNFNDVTTKLSYHISEKDTLEMTFIHSKEQISLLSDASVFDVYGGKRKEGWKTQGFSASYKRQLGKKFRSSLAYMTSRFLNDTHFQYYSLVEGKPNNTISDFSSSNSIDESKVNFQLDYNLKEHYRFSSGMNYSEMATSLIRHQENSSLSTGFFDNHTSDRKLTLFAESIMLLFQKAELNLGLRSNKVEGVAPFSLEPKIRMKYHFTDHFSLSAAWGNYMQFMHRTPSVVPYNLSAIGSIGSWLYSQDGLKPSKADHRVLGVNYDTRPFSVHLSAYYKKYSDLSFFLPTQLDFAYIDNTNREKRRLYIDWIENRTLLKSGDVETDVFYGLGFSKGMEVLLSKNTGMYTGFVSYHYSQSEFMFSYINAGRAFIPSYDREHEIKLMNYLSQKPWNFGCVLYWVSGKPYPNEYMYTSFYHNDRLSLNHPINWEMNSDKRLPAYINVDMSMAYDISLKSKYSATIGMVIQNVFDTQNVISKYYVWEKANEASEELSLKIKDQLSLGRMFNIFISFDF